MDQVGLHVKAALAGAAISAARSRAAISRTRFHARRDDRERKFRTTQFPPDDDLS
jgi:hypothetical protein